MQFNKRTLYLLGLVTLILFPLPTFWVLGYYEGIDPEQIWQLNRLGWKEIGIGLLLGGVYATIALFAMKAKIFESMPNRIEKIVSRMNLSVFDCFFISFCAGFGEEILFRAGMQYYLGPIFTSIIFVGIHGYLNPFNLKMSLYGLIVLPFIFLISYGLPYFGIWFCIAAHFCYDFILFLAMSQGANGSQSGDEWFVEPEDSEEEQ